MSALLRGIGAPGFDRLYRRHAAGVYRYVYAVLGNHADAEDITQSHGAGTVSIRATASAA